MRKPVFLFLAATSLFAAAIDYTAEGKRWWAHIQYLADDKLEGRNVGTDGFRKAVEYVSAEFGAGGTGTRATAISSVGWR